MKIKVALLSAGLGNVSRGFETSAATWFEYLHGANLIDCRLFAGGQYKNAVRIPNISRNSTLANILKRLQLIKDGCRLEQLTFSLSFLIYMIGFKPDILWVQEATLAQMALKFKKIFRFSYKIVFCDGAPVGHQFAKQFDHIVFLEKFAAQKALNDGVPTEKISVIPYICLTPKTFIEKKDARALFGLPENDFVIICVAAWNTHHKRIDYLLNEIALLGQDDVTLLLCGQPEAETVMLKDLAKQLGIKTKWVTLPPSELTKAYFAADIFVLPSLKEGLGAVLIEAGFHKLPVLCHPYDSALYIFGEEYDGLTDLSIKGNLAKKIEAFRKTDLTIKGNEVAVHINNTFNPDMLTQKFISMAEQVYNS
ncbi:a-glycosyltransferase-related protein, glycosyltransferase family 4 protein [Cytophaga hutchinsonii ATCC 33406]|uniref:A-glycosyltransferase-related protein, glycosyltransferase family 4 protein n=2 Tax=Cytophaga hutchinsonii TaxID=985 RepID=A0A6N4SPH3_CYTH3|nr:a-glycosyltransferase-related protein, glycosyltransferase family 4 protein [Cytophaga hutchinsonii ATCC 33406]SFY02692.1 Glycosyl transferases group 1 [Cytophaga hutchinsonii ATCC 33406]